MVRDRCRRRYSVARGTPNARQAGAVPNSAENFSLASISRSLRRRDSSGGSPRAWRLFFESRSPPRSARAWPRSRRVSCSSSAILLRLGCPWAAPCVLAFQAAARPVHPPPVDAATYSGSTSKSPPAATAHPALPVSGIGRLPSAPEACTPR